MENLVLNRQVNNGFGYDLSISEFTLATVKQLQLLNHCHSDRYGIPERWYST